MDANALTSAQLKAARALLGWTQSDLAKQVQVSAVTIRSWERHEGPIKSRPERLREIVAGLAKAGIEFETQRTREVDKLHISLVKRRKPKKPRAKAAAPSKISEAA